LSTFKKSRNLLGTTAAVQSANLPHTGEMQAAPALRSILWQLIKRALIAATAGAATGAAALSIAERVHALPVEGPAGCLTLADGRRLAYEVRQGPVVSNHMRNCKHGADSNPMGEGRCPLSSICLQRVIVGCQSLIIVGVAALLHCLRVSLICAV